MIAPITSFALAQPLPPIELLRALPPGPLAREFAHLERARRLAPMLAALDRDDREIAVELLIEALNADDDVDGDCCAARDDDLASRPVRLGLAATPWWEDEDAEPVLGAPEAASGRWGGCSGSGDPFLDEGEPDDPRARRKHLRRRRRRSAMSASAGVAS